MKIVIADDHAIMREGLKELLTSQEGCEIAGEAHNGREAIALCRQLHPDLVIMDISMPECNGIDATRILKQHAPEIRVVILSVHLEKSSIKEAFAAGADGYIPKKCAFGEISNAMAAVMQGQVYMSPQVATMLVNDFLSPQIDSRPGREVPLSARERLILQRIAEGKRSREIADELHTGLRTVERTRSVIMEKLELHSVADLTKYAIRHGLTTLDS